MGLLENTALVLALIFVPYVLYFGRKALKVTIACLMVMGTLWTGTQALAVYVNAQDTIRLINLVTGV